MRGTAKLEQLNLSNILECFYYRYIFNIETIKIGQSLTFAILN